MTVSLNIWHVLGIVLVWILLWKIWHRYEPRLRQNPCANCGGAKFVREEKWHRCKGCSSRRAVPDTEALERHRARPGKQT